MATPKIPTHQAISAVLRKAEFERSQTLSRAKLHHRYSAGFYTRAEGDAIYVGHRCETPLVSPSAARAKADRQAAVEMVCRYADVIRAAGWQAEVIHLAGALVRVTAKAA